MPYTAHKTLTTLVLAGSLALAGCGGTVQAPNPTPIDFSSFKDFLTNASVLECGFVPAEAMIIAIFNAGAGAGFKAIADEICAVVTSKSVRTGVTQPTILVNGVRIPVAGTFAR
jgi:hypothetical protein